MRGQAADLRRQREEALRPLIVWKTFGGSTEVVEAASTESIVPIEPAEPTVLKLDLRVRNEGPAAYLRTFEVLESDVPLYEAPRELDVTISAGEQYGLPMQIGPVSGRSAQIYHLRVALGARSITPGAPAHEFPADLRVVFGPGLFDVRVTGAPD